MPPCADPGFAHRACDFGGAERRGSKGPRLSWLEPAPAPAPEPAKAFNPFAPAPKGPAFNPFDPRAGAANDDEPAGNPFAPGPRNGPTVAADAPRKLQLLARGLAI